VSNFYERRGTMVFSEDLGPGTAVCVFDCATVEDAERAVTLLNAEADAPAATESTRSLLNDFHAALDRDGAW
jgi:hypothetical protein